MSSADAGAQRALYAGIAGALVGLLAASVVSAAGGAFEDTVPLFGWALPLLALTGEAARRLAARGRMRMAQAAGVALVAGVPLALAWTFVVAKALGPWFGAFGMPVLAIYAVAAVNGIFTGLVLAPRRWVLPLSLASGLALGGVAVQGVPWLVFRLTDRRHIEVVVLRWTPGTEALRAVPFMDGKAFGNLRTEDLDMLRPICPSGRLELQSASGSDFSQVQRLARPLRVLVAFPEHAPAHATVPLPDGERVAVTYRDGAWRVHPLGPPGSRRLEVEPSNPSLRWPCPTARVAGP